jgi:hypothetical protein
VTLWHFFLDFWLHTLWWSPIHVTMILKYHFYKANNKIIQSFL